MIAIPAESWVRGMWGSRWLIAVAAIGATTLAGGCGLIPVSGPNALSVKSGVPWNGPAYGLVSFTPKVVNTLDEYGPRTLSAVLATIGRLRKSISGLATWSASPSSRPRPAVCSSRPRRAFGRAIT